MESARRTLLHERPPNERLLELTCVARLAMGVARDADAVGDWPTVLRLATRERCATLAWLRSAAQIRRFAPADVSNAWRRHALAAIEESMAYASELDVLLTTLISGGATPMVLKGQPMAVQLYGDAAARPLSDVDLFIPAEQRDRAHDVLVHNGWQHLEGFAPSEGTYRRSGSARNAHLELHSSILDDALLAHFVVPAPKSEPVELYGVTVSAPCGPLVPLFLAVHLAKHALVPLLWWVDFDAASRRMSSAERVAMRTMATDLGLDRYLAWAEAGIEQLRASTNTDGTVATEAMRSLLDLHARHNAVRVAMLARSTRRRFAVMAAWIWPPTLRRAPLTYARSALARLLRAFARTVGQTAARHGEHLSSAVNPNARIVEVLRPELIDLVRTAINERVPVWIRVRGTSMLPTIPRVAEVRVRALPSRSIRRGDVVLAQLPGGQPVLHRVHDLSGDEIVLRGDNMRRSDEPVACGGIIAVADLVRAEGKTYPLTVHPQWSLRMTLGRWRSRLGRWRSNA